MNKNVAIMFALVTLLLVAALFEDDGAIPAIAKAGASAQQDSQSDRVDNERAVSDSAAQSAVMQPVTAAGQLTPPPPPVNEPDPPFVQPEPLK